MGKIIILILTLCLNYLLLYSQEEEILTYNIVTIGKNYITNKSIKANEYTIGIRLYSIYNDTISNSLTFQFRDLKDYSNKEFKTIGKILLFEKNTNQIKWVQKINYENSKINQIDNAIIKTIDKNSYFINRNTGKINDYFFSNDLKYINTKRKIGIGYAEDTYSDRTKIKLVCSSLKNGKILWEIPPNGLLDWNEVYDLTDSLILVVSDYLYIINTYNGKMFSYTTGTVKGDNIKAGAIFAYLALDIAMALTTGYVFIPLDNRLFVRKSLNTDIIIDSNLNYIAIKDKISCINNSGKEVWYKFTEDNSLKTPTIFIKDSCLYNVNYKKNKMIFSCYDKNNGREIYLNKIKNDTNLIDTIMFDKDTLILFCKYSVAKYSFSNGKKISEKFIDFSERIKKSLDENVYYKKDSIYLPIISIDTSKYYLYSKSGKTIELNKNSSSLKYVNIVDTYFCYYKFKYFKFLGNNNKTIVIDNNNRMVAEIDISYNSFLYGTMLYNINGKIITEIDIKEFMK